MLKEYLYTILFCHHCKQASLLFSRSSRGAAAAAAATAGTTAGTADSTDKRSSVVRGLRSASGATAGTGTTAAIATHSVIDIGAGVRGDYLSPRHTATATAAGAASTASTAAHTRPLSAKRSAPTVLGDMEKVTLHSIQYILTAYSAVGFSSVEYVCNCRRA
jgi:hypothetical protein